MSFIYTLIIMAIVFGAIYWFQNRNNEEIIKADHEYFTRLWLWPQGEHTRWEAEYDLESKYSNGTIGLHAEDNYHLSLHPEPTNEEIDFAKVYLSNLELLFPEVLTGAKQGWCEWFKEELPENWETQFTIDGFSVPVSGNNNNKWGVMLYCDKAGHYFDISIENGHSKLESIDG